ncbi:hypothetical protein ACH5BF_07745 [Arcobacter sp. YIC-464]|uniref:hypothetical protein n=1 Tax=Arcobacter sp. YIC-464 TaxID=3376631 RepID=UPI003C21B6D8
MAQDQIITIQDEVGNSLNVLKISLNLDKDIYLLHVFEEDYTLRKKYLRNDLILVENQILTSSFSDTIHFIEELRLFDVGNDQNKFLSITEYKKTRNLKLKQFDKKNIFISKSEAKAICKLFDFALRGYSLATVLESEFSFTPQTLTNVLHENRLLEKN